MEVSHLLEATAGSASPCSMTGVFRCLMAAWVWGGRTLATVAPGPQDLGVKSGLIKRETVLNLGHDRTRSEFRGACARSVTDDLREAGGACPFKCIHDTVYREAAG